MPLYLWHMPLISALSLTLLAGCNTAPHPDFVMLALLPDEWHLPMYAVAAASILIVLLVDKKLGRAR